MNILLWVVAGLLALAFLVSGALKILRSREQLRESGLGWVDDFSDGAVKGIGAAEVLGALGLVLPAVTGIAPVLVPLAATGLALTMVGAAITHGRRGETQMIIVNVVLLLLAAFVAWGRFGAYAF